MGFMLTLEPNSGLTIRARYAAHHTAGVLWTRDDREGHGDPVQAPRHWWSHDMGKWMSWPEIHEFLAEQDEDMVLEPMYSPPSLPGCEPDGQCGDVCPLVSSS